MSNYLAIATVTGTLQNVLGSAASVVPGAAVTTTRPDSAVSSPSGAGINVFLYQVMPNPAYRNTDLPTRRSDGQLVQRPQAALVLHYLLSFFGDDSKLEAHLLLGATVRQLHAQAALTTQQVQQTVVSRPELVLSNLADQPDLVRFTPMSLSLEELSKLWSTFFEIPYVLSIAYEASAVLIETDDAPLRALQVKARNLYVLPFRQPQIDSVVSQAGDAEPIFSDSVLLIKGKQLKGDDTKVLLGGVEFAPQSVTDSQITLPVPPGTQAGVQGLQVIQKLSLGTPPLPHPGFESNVATFVLRPRITAPATKTTVQDVGGGPPSPGLKVDVDVIVGASQRIVLLLNSTPTGNSLAYSFVAPARSSNASSVTIATPNVAAGEYFLRVQIDGAASPLELDPANTKFGPKVLMP
ncbi:Protein of unknown function [Burkholderia sp. YR290]|nr:Protein of unknown function [Burkholderia sp. YR290]